MQAPLIQHLTTVFEHGIAAATKLLQALESERTALTERRAADFETAVCEKQQHVAALEGVEREVRTLLGVPKADNIEMVLQRAGIAAGHPAARLRDELRKLIAQCQRQNLINGKIIDLNRRQTQDLLGTLLGQPIQPQVYGPTGQAETRESSTLTKA